MAFFIFISCLTQDVLKKSYSVSGTANGSGLLCKGTDIKPCVSSSAWYLFGLLHFDLFLVGYLKNCTPADKFWIN